MAMQICRNPENLISHFEKQHWLLIIVINSSVSKFFPQVKHPISSDWNIYVFVLNYQHFHRQQLCASLRADINWNFGSSFLWAFGWMRYFQILFPWVFIIWIYKDIYIYYISAYLYYIYVKVLGPQSCPWTI